MKYAQFQEGPNCKDVKELIWIMSGDESDILAKALVEYVKAHPRLKKAKALLAELDYASIVF